MSVEGASGRKGNAFQAFSVLRGDEKETEANTDQIEGRDCFLFQMEMSGKEGLLVFFEKPINLKIFRRRTKPPVIIDFHPNKRGNMKFLSKEM